MASTIPEHFATPRKYAWFLLGGSLFIAFLAVIAAIGFLNALSENKFSFMNFCGALVFPVVAVFSFRDAIRLRRSAVLVDAEGIWYAHLDRETALVPWDQVYNVRDRPLFQRIELRSETGQVLVIIDHQMREFERLRAIIAARLEERECLQDLPWTISCPRHHQLYDVCFFTILVAGVFVLPHVDHPVWWLIAGGAYVALYVFSTLTALNRLVIHPDHLEFRYGLRHPIRWQKVDVADVDIEDKFNEGDRYGLVAVHHENGEKVLLVGLEIGTIRLHSILKAWLAEPIAEPADATRSAEQEA